MPINFAADIADILSEPAGDLPLTSGVYAQGTASLPAVKGFLFNHRTDPDPEEGIDEETAQLLVEATEFAGAVTKPERGDRWTPAGIQAFHVRAVERDQAHFHFRLGRRPRRGVA